MKLVVRCPKHPAYRGLRDPRVDCVECRFIRFIRGAKFRRGPATATVGE